MSTLNQKVLVLNKLWQAVNVCSVKRALTLLFEGRAEVVMELEGQTQTFGFQEWCDFSAQGNAEEGIQTISLKIRIPKVIMLLFYDKQKRPDVRLTRNNIFLRDHDTCQYCGEKLDRSDLNLDHVIPRDQGGRSTWENLVCSCIECNNRKANRTPAQAHMRLLKVPKKPQWVPFLRLTLGKGEGISEWDRFVSAAYWNASLT